MFGRFNNVNYIRTLDPEKDCAEIVRIVGTLEYPWLIKKSLEFALFRTYAVPHTSRILAASGQFDRHGQKRYDDTTLMLAGIAEKGFDSEYGQKAIQRMNELHGRWNIKNTDMLYVLSTFIFEPIRWHDAYGWRKPTQNEKLANYYFWKEVGIRMGIENIPESLEAYERFNIEHEKQYFRYDDANRKIGRATMQVFLNWYPRLLHPIVREGLLSFMDDPLLNAMGFEKPYGLVRGVYHYGLKLFGKFLRFMPPRSKPYIYTELPNRTYPQGYKVEELGPQYPDGRAAGD
jgi:hypothetical protein